MRIDTLTMERYGIFADRVLSFRPDAALHIVHGANEAGKTSVLSAVGDLLFGFGARTLYDFRHDSRQLRIGGAFRHSDGRILTARRRKGTKNTLIDGADQPLADDALAPFLGGLSREAFNREFGLTAEALRKGGDELLNAGGRLAETLAASSAGLSALSHIKERLRVEADDLFTARRSSGKPFYMASDRREGADRALREATVTRDALRQLETEVREAHERLEALNKDHADSVGQLALWQRTLRVRSKLVRLDGLEAELKAFADLPAVSEAALAQWRDALDADADVSRDIAVLDAAEAVDAKAVAELAIDDTLLAEGEVIDALRERVGAVRKAMDDLPRRRQAREAAEAALADAAHRLGLASSRDLLDRLPTDPALAQARALIEKQKRAVQSATDADLRHGRARQEHDAIEAQEGVRIAAVDPDGLRARFDALGDIPAQADRLHRETAALAVEIESLGAQAAALDPSPGTLESLRTRPLPDAAAIDAHARDFEHIENDIRRLGEALAAADRAIAAVEAELARLSQSGAVPTRADLVGARRERDARFDSLRAALDADRETRDAKFVDAVRSSHTVDDVTDRLLNDAERAAGHESAQHRLATSRKERDA
ncbi:MAG: AAA family ATPase, partial [Rhodospirillales bacterium]|nr:AAA family ATPase [Rhodospirillales bacterium]